MALDLAEVDAVLRAAFPAAGGVAALDCVESAIVDDTLRLTVCLVTYDREGDEVQIRDVKEQELAVAPAAMEPARFAAFARAWSAVLSRCFAAADEATTWETLMPHDLFFGAVLRLKTAHTEDDFVKALSRSSRLGRWLAQAAAPALARG